MYRSFSAFFLGLFDYYVIFFRGFEDFLAQYDRALDLALERTAFAATGVIAFKHLAGMWTLDVLYLLLGSCGVVVCVPLGQLMYGLVPVYAELGYGQGVKPADLGQGGPVLEAVKQLLAPITLGTTQHDLAKHRYGIVHHGLGKFAQLSLRRRCGLLFNA